MQAADWIALWALVVAVLALLVALWAIYKGNRNSSVSTMVTLQDATRDAWKRYFEESDADKKWSEFCDLMNLLETSAAILNERSIVGVSKELLSDHLQAQVGLLKDDQMASAEIVKMMTTESTFAHLKKFYKEEHSQPLSVTRPKGWYQQ